LCPDYRDLVSEATRALVMTALIDPVRDEQAAGAYIPHSRRFLHRMRNLVQVKAATEL
jgi:hypothetical protein